MEKCDTVRFDTHEIHSCHNFFPTRFAHIYTDNDFFFSLGGRVRVVVLFLIAIATPGKFWNEEITFFHFVYFLELIGCFQRAQPLLHRWLQCGSRCRLLFAVLCCFSTARRSCTLAWRVVFFAEAYTCQQSNQIRVSRVPVSWFTGDTGFRWSGSDWWSHERSCPAGDLSRSSCGNACICFRQGQYCLSLFVVWRWSPL